MGTEERKRGRDNSTTKIGFELSQRARSHVAMNAKCQTHHLQSSHRLQAYVDESKDSHIILIRLKIDSRSSGDCCANGNLLHVSITSEGCRRCWCWISPSKLPRVYRLTGLITLSATTKVTTEKCVHIFRGLLWIWKTNNEKNDFALARCQPERSETLKNFKILIFLE